MSSRSTVIIIYNDEQFELKWSGCRIKKSPRSRKTLTLNNSTKNDAIQMYHSSLDRVKKELSKRGIDSQIT